MKQKTTYQRQKDRASRAIITAAIARLDPRYQQLHDTWPFIAVLGATDRAYCRQYATARNRLNVLKRTILAQPHRNVVVTSAADMPDPAFLRASRIQKIQRLWSFGIYIMQTTSQAQALLRKVRMIGRIHDFSRGDTRLLLCPYELRSHGSKIRVYPSSELIQARNELEDIILYDKSIAMISRILAVNMIERRIGAFRGLPDWERENIHRKEVSDYVCQRGGRRTARLVHFARYSQKKRCPSMTDGSPRR